MKRLGLVDSGELPRGDPRRGLPRRYFFITPKALKEVYAEDTRGGRPPGETTLPLRLGILSFCCLGGLPVVKLAPREVTEVLPQLASSSLPIDRYYQDVRTAKIGYLYVHHHAEARSVQSVYRKIISQRFNASQAWRDCIRQGGFEVAVVTSNIDKRDRIATAIGSGHQDVSVVLHVEPLLDLLT